MVKMGIQPQLRSHRAGNDEDNDQPNESAIARGRQHLANRANSKRRLRHRKSNKTAEDAARWAGTRQVACLANQVARAGVRISTGLPGSAVCSEPDENSILPSEADGTRTRNHWIDSPVL